MVPIFVAMSGRAMSTAQKGTLSSDGIWRVM
jgi:hypothetical protein